MSRLNGFQRLWLVSCGIVAIALVITFFVTKPKESDFTARIWPEKDDWRAATLKASSEELNELFRTQRAPSDARVLQRLISGTLGILSNTLLATIVRLAGTSLCGCTGPYSRTP